MFDIADRPRAWIEVVWPGIAAREIDGRAIEVENKIELFCEIVDRPDLKRLFPRLLGDEDAPLPDELDLFCELASDWRQAGGSQRKVLNNGKEVPFNRKNAALLLEKPMFGPAFTAAYMAAVGGRVRLREGNSESSPSGGRAGEEQAATTTTSSPATASGSE